MALTSVKVAIQWFIDQKKTNDEAIVCLRDMRDTIGRPIEDCQSS